MDAAIWVVSGGVVGILGFAFSVWKFHSGERGKIYTRIAEVQGELNAFKLYAASHFASVPSLEAATTKMATAVDGMNKRLDDMLALVAEMQAGREQQRSKGGPRRTGQTNHMFGIRDGSQSNGYQKRGTKPGRKTDFTKDPVVIAKRQQALAQLKAAE